MHCVYTQIFILCFYIKHYKFVTFNSNIYELIFRVIVTIRSYSYKKCRENHIFGFYNFYIIIWIQPLRGLGIVVITWLWVLSELILSIDYGVRACSFPLFCCPVPLSPNPQKYYSFFPHSLFYFPVSCILLYLFYKE